MSLLSGKFTKSKWKDYRVYIVKSVVQAACDNWPEYSDRVLAVPIDLCPPKIDGTLIGKFVMIEPQRFPVPETGALNPYRMVPESGHFSKPKRASQGSGTSLTSKTYMRLELNFSVKGHFSTFLSGPMAATILCVNGTRDVPIKISRPVTVVDLVEPISLVHPRSGILVELMAGLSSAMDILGPRPYPNPQTKVTLGAAVVGYDRYSLDWSRWTDLVVPTGGRHEQIGRVRLKFLGHVEGSDSVAPRLVDFKEFQRVEQRITQAYKDSDAKNGIFYYHRQYSTIPLRIHSPWTAGLAARARLRTSDSWVSKWLCGYAIINYLDPRPWENILAMAFCVSREQCTSDPSNGEILARALSVELKSIGYVPDQFGDSFELMFLRKIAFGDCEDGTNFQSVLFAMLKKSPEERISRILSEKLKCPHFKRGLPRFDYTFVTMTTVSTDKTAYSHDVGILVPDEMWDFMRGKPESKFPAQPRPVLLCEWMGDAEVFIGDKAATQTVQSYVDKKSYCIFSSVWTPEGPYRLINTKTHEMGIPAEWLFNTPEKLRDVFAEQMASMDLIQGQLKGFLQDVAKLCPRRLSERNMISLHESKEVYLNDSLKIRPL
jgi:hypothetical protein